MTVDTTKWKKRKTEADMAVDELLLRWEELERKKKMMDQFIVELKKDVSQVCRTYPELHVK